MACWRWVSIWVSLLVLKTWPWAIRSSDFSSVKCPLTPSQTSFLVYFFKFYFHTSFLFSVLPAGWTLWITCSALGLYFWSEWKPLIKKEGPLLRPFTPPLSFPGCLFSYNPQNCSCLAVNGAHQVICEPYLTRAWKKPQPPPLLLSVHLPVQPWNDTPI